VSRDDGQSEWIQQQSRFTNRPIEVEGIGHAQEQSVIILIETLQSVARFTYFGSVIDRKGNLDADVNIRIGKTAAVLRRLNNERCFHTFNLDIKLNLYISIVYITDCNIRERNMEKHWKNKTQDGRIFHQRNLDRITGVTWKDRVTDVEVLKRTVYKELRKTS